jgi:hypothetical protein
LFPTSLVTARSTRWRPFLLKPYRVVVLFAVISTWVWLPSNFVKPTTVGMGEVFEAYHAALNLERFGWRWAGLQDMATNPREEAHPFLYIHHANLGLLLSYALRVLGMKSLEWQNFVSLLGSIAGLLVAYAAVRRLTGSLFVPLVFLILLALNVNYVTNWAFNIHRAFSYLGPFGAAYSYWALAASRYQNPAWLGMLFLSCVLLLCADYMFFSFTLLVLACYTLLSRFQQELKFVFRGLLVLSSIFGGVFMLRQIQVVAGVGLDVWKHDFLYQVLNRLHLEYLFEGDWSKTTTDFYASHSILNPGFAPYAPWEERMLQFLKGTGAAYVTDVLGVPAPPVDLTLWVGTMLLSAVVLLVATHVLGSAVGFPWSLAVSRGIAGLAVAGTLIGMAAAGTHNWQPVGRAVGPVIALFSLAGTGLVLLLLNRGLLWADAPGRLSAAPGLGFAFLVGCVSMYALFPRYFAQWYPVFLLAPLCAAVWTTALFSPVLFWLERRPHHAVVLILCLVLLRGIASLPIVLASHVNEGDHATALREIAGQPTASNFTPASVASYTHAFSGWLRPDGAERLFLHGTVSPDDYFMIFEVDRLHNRQYTRPDYYVLYKFPGSDQQLERLVKAGAVILKEGNTYALFRVPHAVQ